MSCFNKWIHFIDLINTYKVNKIINNGEKNGLLIKYKNKNYCSHCLNNMKITLLKEEEFCYRCSKDCRKFQYKEEADYEMDKALRELDKKNCISFIKLITILLANSPSAKFSHLVRFLHL